MLSTTQISGKLAIYGWALSNEIERAGGLYKRDFGKSREVGIGDTILAATVGKEKAELKPLDGKHYPMISGLEPAYRK